MLVMGIDTSGAVGSVGLYNDDGVLGEINIKLKRRHSERLLPVIDRLLMECGREIDQINGVGVVTGPGSFTGLRIGMSTAKSFAQVLNIPVVGLSSLDILAYNLIIAEGWIVPVIDARNARVYTSLYRGWSRDIKNAKVRDERALSVNDLINELSSIDDGKPFYFVGNGVEEYREVWEKAGFNCVLAPRSAGIPHGGSIAELSFLSSEKWPGAKLPGGQCQLSEKAPG